jgi:zinc-ribbon domain
MSTGSLVCPSCGREHPARERFCGACGMPLVYRGAGEYEASERQRRARKIKPQYSEGELTRVVGARNQVEADFIQNLLLEEGIPSMQRRARGFDVPDFLAAGPREILVPASGVPAARDVLLQSELLPTAQTLQWAPTAWRVLAFLLLGLVVLAILVWLHG